LELCGDIYMQRDPRINSSECRLAVLKSLADYMLAS